MLPVSAVHNSALDRGAIQPHCDKRHRIMTALNTSNHCRHGKHGETPTTIHVAYADRAPEQRNSEALASAVAIAGGVEGLAPPHRRQRLRPYSQ